GMPVSQYINYTRIEIAKDLIRDGVSVTRVADMTGFCDYGYFGKVFKKYFGVPPAVMNRME
ncbi:MAG: helix-turn-helix domain-containing protein, partial [Clostridia bacterium]|nr:helix-turn-helix domain-containing protein [Clostridia bacterium]